jgi:hypothetical protein
MTTSSVTTWNPVRDKILKKSLRLVHAYASNDEPRPEQLIDALETMNMMLKSWQVDGLSWLNQFATLFLNEGQSVYYLAPRTYTGFSHCATDYIQTTLTATIAIGGSVAALTSTTGITTGDYVGIENNSGTIEWFTGTKSGLNITLSSTMAVAATSGNLVYSHTLASQIKRPTKVTARRKMYDSSAADGSETEIDMISRSDYENIPSKTSEGVIVQAYYDPQLVSGKLYVWPTADYCGDKLVLSIDRPIDDVVADTETIDLPVEWMEAITYGLADRISPEYQLPLEEQNMLATRALTSYNRILNFNRGETSIYFDMR